MKSKSAQISIALVCLIMGVLLAVQFKATENYQADLIPERVDELTQKLNTVTKQKDALEEEVLSLRDKLINVRETDKAMKDLQGELQKAQMAAGTIPVEGPGVTVSLNDSNLNMQPGDNANYSIVHDSDLLIIVNELKASGAEAISINGERLTAMSEIRCAGTLILVNWTKIGPPFTIQAIGDPEMLQSGLMLNGGHLSTLKFLGLQTSVQRMENIKLPAYNGPTKIKYALPSQYKEKAE
ncbi:division initiation protein [hydrocarbon metagenome]|uniref:Division initiation protein n=1 Tax=hydrocarbon metagenome TaxID=938273 RepID=A0A0W8E4K1_9ZZZZ